MTRPALDNKKESAHGTPFHHALSSVKKWGGKVGDYLPLHQFLDESKSYLADTRHRALRHHAEGIFLCERVFGVTLTNSDGRVIPVRWVGEQHVKEDLGWIPTAVDWLRCIKHEPWMGRTGKLPLSKEELEAAAPGMTTGPESREASAAWKYPQKCARCGHTRGEHLDERDEPSYCHGPGMCDCDDFLKEDV